MDRIELRHYLETAVTPGLAFESVNAGKDDLLALLDAAERGEREVRLRIEVEEQLGTCEDELATTAARYATAAERADELKDENNFMRNRTASLGEYGGCPCEETLVPIPDFVFEGGGIYEFDPTHPEYGIDDQGRRCLRLDKHIVPAIEALWAAGIVTRSCCSGHGSGWGVITVQPDCPLSAGPHE